MKHAQRNLTTNRFARSRLSSLALAVPLVLFTSAVADDPCEPQWDGTIGEPGMDDAVSALTEWNGDLIAGGWFESAGGQTVNHIARWDGTQWHPFESGGQIGVGGGVPRVYALMVHDGDLIVGGHFETAGGQTVNNIARWDGGEWSPLSSGMSYDLASPSVHSLAVFDDGSDPALYAGGSFDTAGGVPANHIAKWDGEEWSPVGGGTGGLDRVNALTVFDDDSGPALYVGGSFDTVGGVTANGIAKWDGEEWPPLGTGVISNNWVRALTVFDDGSGPALYAGEEWSPLGSGMDGTGSVRALTVFDDGSGPALYAGGTFDTVGGETVNRIAKWDGEEWSAGNTRCGRTRVLSRIDNTAATSGRCRACS